MELATKLLKLKSKDRRELRTDVVGGKARDSAKQWQRSGAEISPCAVVALLISERHPLIPFVLKVARKEITAIAAGAESSRVACLGLIVAVIKKCGPSGIASFRICI